MKFLFGQYLLLLLFLGLTLFSCTTIKIHEKDAFDSKRTITASDFAQEGIQIEEVYFLSDDTTKIRAWHLQHEEPKGTVLYLGGNGFLLAISRDILTSIYNQDMNVFAFDYRGYGQSAGRPSISGLKRDSQSAYDYLKNKVSVQQQNLIIHGHSMGSFFALWLANNNPAAAVVLESPITNVEDLTDHWVPWMVKPFISFEIDPQLANENNLTEIKKLQKPVLIISGEKDNITPKGMAETLYEESTSSVKELVLIVDGGHNDLPLNMDYQSELKTFYQRFF